MIAAERLPIWPGVRMPRAILAKGRSPIDGAPTHPWVQWVLADAGYVVHVTRSLDRDGPWKTYCGASPLTGRILHRLSSQGERVRLCAECLLNAEGFRGEGQPGSLRLRARLESYRVVQPRLSMREADTECWLERQP